VPRPPLAFTFDFEIGTAHRFHPPPALTESVLTRTENVFLEAVCFDSSEFVWPTVYGHPRSTSFLTGDPRSARSVRALRLRGTRAALDDSVMAIWIASFPAQNGFCAGDLGSPDPVVPLQGLFGRGSCTSPAVSRLRIDPPTDSRCRQDVRKIGTSFWTRRSGIANPESLRNWLPILKRSRVGVRDACLCETLRTSWSGQNNGAKTLSNSIREVWGQDVHAVPSIPLDLSQR
jgi:hypothetical protein